jgi:hypothetical protein
MGSDSERVWAPGARWRRSVGPQTRSYRSVFRFRVHAVKVEVDAMALASVHACDCSNGFTYVGEISISKTAGVAGAPAKEETALSNYFVISTKLLVDRTWIREMGEDHKEHYRYVPIASVAAALYRKLREKGTLNPKLVKLPNVDANHELDV